MAFVASALLDADAVLPAQPVEAGREPGGVGAEDPVAPALDELTEHDDDLEGRLHVQLVLGELLTRVGVGRADVGVVDQPEVLLASSSLVDGDREDDLLDLGGDLGQVHLDHLVVAVAGAGQVVAGVVQCTLRAVQVAPEDEVSVGANRPGGGQQERAGIEVEIGATHLAALGIPAEPDVEVGQRPASLLGEVDLAALGQRNRHLDFLSVVLALVGERVIIPRADARGDRVP